MTEMLHAENNSLIRASARPTTNNGGYEYNDGQRVGEFHAADEAVVLAS